ncbi:hypothetical protein [Motilibacter rhizosphaerae]|nr:hypothetical protein [Motilibacter rhizosphaerae]
MSAFLAGIAVSLLLAALVLALVAYPHRGRRVPGPEVLSGALDRVGSKVTDALDEVSA